MSKAFKYLVLFFIYLFWTVIAKLGARNINLPFIPDQEITNPSKTDYDAGTIFLVTLSVLFVLAVVVGILYENRQVRPGKKKRTELNSLNPDNLFKIQWIAGFMLMQYSATEFINVIGNMQTYLKNTGSNYPLGLVIGFSFFVFIAIIVVYAVIVEAKKKQLMALPQIIKSPVHYSTSTVRYRALSLSPVFTISGHY